MAKSPPLWQQANSYPAQLDRGLLATLWPSGGALGGAPTAVANTMNVSVPPGACAVPLQPGQGSAVCRWDAAEIVALDPGSAQARVDLIVAQVRDASIDGGANNDFVFVAVKGTPAASNPVAPAVPANALAITAVPVAAGAVNLNGVALTERRPLMTVLRQAYQRSASQPANGNAGCAPPSSPYHVQGTGLSPFSLMTFTAPCLVHLKFEVDGCSSGDWMQVVSGTVAPGMASSTQYWRATQNWGGAYTLQGGNTYLRLPGEALDINEFCQGGASIVAHLELVYQGIPSYSII